MAERLIKTIYVGRDGSAGKGSSVTLEGAIRAAVTRLLAEQYDSAVIYDLRFGGAISEQTRAIDSGFSNIELKHSVDLALGGSVIDTKDTALDALLTGVGGLGMFATIQGINHAAELYENGGDGVESLFAGAGVAIEGTARALVGTAELGYKVLASAPSRFVGRTLLAGLKRLDDKMMEAGSKSE